MKRLSLFVTSLLMSSLAFSIVDMRNANYADTWPDLIVPGSGYDLRVARTYNSRSLFDGMFGFGWCSDFETTIKVTPEGNIQLKECGGGMEVVYLPQGHDRRSVDKTVSAIIQKVRKSERRTPAYLSNLSKKLRQDLNLREKYSQKYSLNKKLNSSVKKFYANGKEVEHFYVKGGLFYRVLPDGSKEVFTKKGHMIRKTDKNRNFLKLSYTGQGVLKEVVDNNGRKLLFKYHKNSKKVKEIFGPSGLKAEYKYKNGDDLVWVKNAWKNVYTMGYDDLHNLVKMTYPDKTTKELTYNKNKDWVTSFKDREGCVESYKYEEDKKQPEFHYWSIVQKTCGKKIVNRSRYEFWYKKRKSDKQPYLHRVLSKVNANVTDIIYHEVFGKPISLRHNANRTVFSYYPNGLVRSKKTGPQLLQFQYNKKFKSVSEVKTTLYNNKGKRVSSRSTYFKYDKRGNLKFAENTEGQKVWLTHDSKGRIATIKDQSKKVVTIKYEARFGKPSYVNRPGLGAIRVTYKKDGSIKQVKSKQGPRVAVQVASTFNNLLDIVAPATTEVSL